MSFPCVGRKPVRICRVHLQARPQDFEDNIKAPFHRYLSILIYIYAYVSIYIHIGIPFLSICRVYEFLIFD